MIDNNTDEEQWFDSHSGAFLDKAEQEKMDALWLEQWRKHWEPRRRENGKFGRLQAAP